MNYSLKEHEVLSMGQAMETHRTQKNKVGQQQTSEMIKQQKAVYRQSGNFGHNIRM